MDFVKYILVLVVFFVDSDAGGHGGKHHDHVKLHIPKFIHHDRHTKVITIHHHHHKPKKEHHHHHHHHHKPQIPHIPHQHIHHNTKISTTTVSKGQSNHHGHKSHHGHYGHHGHHSHKHHDPSPSYDPSSSYDPPSINYEPPSVNYAPPTPSVNYFPPVNYDASPSFGGNHDSFSPSTPNIPSSPNVRGVVHTVKQVKVFDSLPGTLQGGKTGATGTHGYEVTEQGDEDEEDVFTSVNSLSQSYPGTYGFVRSAAAESEGDPFSELTQQSIQSPNHDPFASAQPQQTYSNLEDFTIQAKQLAHPLPGVQSPQLSIASEYDEPGNPIIINDVNNFAVTGDDETPVTFTREAGIQHLLNTEGIETVAY